jgi:streptogramin lyase/tRNA A-37 threonylcarbamoyl transferase component Bud32
MGAQLGQGVTFANHRIEAEIGRGGMGVVYRAHELALDRERALKVVADELASDPRFSQRFRREARLAASVDHPNVIAVHQAGEVDGLPYLSMSLVEGPDLGTLVDATGPMDPGRAGVLITQVAAGLEAAHARGLVHRDVKPSNVLVADHDGGERAVVTDFGLSRLVGEDQGITQTGDFLGSTDYVSPEQIEGEGVDGRADVYSLGALAFFLLTGHAPFAGRSEAAKLVAHVNADRPRPSNAGAPSSPAIDDAVVRAMAVEPSERFATPTAFADAFAAGVAGGPAVPEPGVAVGVGIVAVAAAAVIFLLSLGEATQGPPPIKPDLADIPAGRETAAIEVGQGPTALATKSGVTRVAARDAGLVQSIPVSGQHLKREQEVDLGPDAEPSSVAVGFGSLWIVDEDRLVRTSGGASAPVDFPLGGGPKDVVASPTGIWVALEDSDEVARIDPATNAASDELPVCDGPRTVSYGDGGIWAVCIEAGTVLRIDEDAARVEGKPIPAGTRPNDLAVGTDGIWVIDNLEGVVRRIDPKTLHVSKPIEVGARPRGIVAARGSVWISNSEDGTVTRIRESDRRQVADPIEVGDGPADISAGGGFIWTANFLSNTVSRIEPG